MIKNVNGHPVGYAFSGLNLGTVAPILTGFLGYKGAKDQAAQQAANNALLKEQYDYEKSIRAPAVTGAQNALAGGHWVDSAGNPVAEGTEGAQWRSQFQPFVDAQGQQAVAAGNIANQYLANVPQFQQAGLAGLQGYQNLANMDPAAQQALQAEYMKGDLQAQYDLAADDINRATRDARRNAAMRANRRGSTLAGQAARVAGDIERGRNDALHRAATNTAAEAYQRAQTELGRRQNLASALSSLGQTGLSQASSAASLGATAAQQGIDAPFQPYNAYSAAIGDAPKVRTPQYQPVSNPLATGVGLGLQSWNTFNPQRR